MVKKKVRRKISSKILFVISLLILCVATYFASSSFYFDYDNVDTETLKAENVYPQKYSFQLFMVGDAFIDSLFNLVSLATNHTMDMGRLAFDILLIISLNRIMLYGMVNVYSKKNVIRLEFMYAMV